MIYAKTGNTIQSVERALDILFAIARAKEAGITELARELDMHVPTVSNLVRTLTSRCVLINRGGRYFLGPALAALLAGDSWPAHLHEIVKEAVCHISQATGESAVAFAASGDKVELIFFQPSADQLIVHFPPAILKKPLDLSSGKVLTAYQPEKARRRIVERHLLDRTLGEKARSRAFKMWKTIFEQIRRTGYFASDISADFSTDSVVAPVFDSGRQVVCVLGVSYPRARSTAKYLKTMLRVVCDEVKRLSKDLGYKSSNGTTKNASHRKHTQNKEHPK